MITQVRNDSGPVKCPVCKKDLDGRITFAQVPGEIKPKWTHIKCLTSR